MSSSKTFAVFCALVFFGYGLFCLFLLRFAPTPGCRIIGWTMASLSLTASAIITALAAYDK